MCTQVYLDDENKSRVVQLILTKRTEAAFELLSTLYRIKKPKLRVGTVKGHRRTALAVYVKKNNTIYASTSVMMFNPFVMLHEFYHHIRSRSGVHKGTEKFADTFAKDFLKAYVKYTTQHEL
ncbi:MAG: hypothetical protein V3T40_04915 [Nitrososphaerales archaeon]